MCVLIADGACKRRSIVRDVCNFKLYSNIAISNYLSFVFVIDPG
jgi:hypothetical protein